MPIKTEVQKIIDDLIAKEATDVYYGGSYKQQDLENRDIATIHRIYYREDGSRFKTVELSEKDDNLEFYGSKPTILVERTPASPQRNFHFSEQEIISEVERVPENTGWKIQKVEQRRDGDFDIVDLQVDVDEDHIIFPQYVTWIDDQETKQCRKVK